MAIAAFVGIALMLAWKPDVLRPDVPAFMGAWKPAKEHRGRMNRVCSVNDPHESVLGCIWGSTVGGLWVLVKYLIAGFVAVTRLPALLIGGAAGLIVGAMLVGIGRTIFNTT